MKKKFKERIATWIIGWLTTIKRRNNRYSIGKMSQEIEIANI